MEKSCAQGSQASQASQEVQYDMEVWEKGQQQELKDSQQESFLKEKHDIL